MRKLLLALLLLPSFAFAIDYEANVKALSPRIWTKGYYGNTVASQVIAATRDFSGNSRTFTQVPGTARPAASRQDNRENYLFYSSDLTNAIWNPARLTPSAGEADPTGGTAAFKLLESNDGAPTTHYWKQSLGDRAYNKTYTYQVYATSATLDLWLYFFGAGISCGKEYDLQTGAVNAWDSTGCTITTSTSVDVGGGWRLLTLTATITVNQASFELYNYLGNGGYNYQGDGTKFVTVYHPTLRSSLADSNFVETTGSQFRGVSGLPGIHFDGLNDSLTSTATLADIFTTSTKHFFMVVRFDGFPSSGTKLLLYDSIGVFRLMTDVANLQLGNLSGAVWQNTPNIPVVVNTPYIIEAKHTGGNLYLSVNGAAPVSIASGNTDGAMGGTLILGGTGSNYANMDLTEFLAWNSILSTPNAQKVYDYLSWTLNNPWKRIEVTP